MKNIPYYTATPETWLIYLRKSRADSPDESVEEVLQKHETILQDWAKRELGRIIPEDDIYREVVSGESIDERIEIKRLLARIEDPSVVGVVVVEPQRLSRGDLEDCGRLINDLRYTNTLVATPTMTYNLDNKMERRFFQDELLRGRDYLEYTKEILMRGRIASVKRGCYIGNTAPYGYDKIKIGKDHTLTPNDNADVVRLIFDMYTKEDMTPGMIAKRLNQMGTPAPRGDKWVKDSIRGIVRNVHYIGKVVFNRIKSTTVVENGERKVKRLAQPEEDVIIAEGKHPAIISAETWQRAQELVARHPRKKHEHELRNPLSGVLICSKCNKAMHIHPYKHAVDRYECRTIPRCYKSIQEPALINAVILALQESELPNLEAKVKNDDGNSAKIQQQLLDRLNKQMDEYRAQEDKQYELLETGKYTQDLFDRRNAALRAKMDECQTKIYQAKASMPKAINYEDKVVALKAAIEALSDPTATPAEKNRVLKTIIDRIEYTGSPSDSANKKRQSRGVIDPFKLEIFLRL